MLSGCWVIDEVGAMMTVAFVAAAGPWCVASVLEAMLRGVFDLCLDVVGWGSANGDGDDLGCYFDVRRLHGHHLDHILALGNGGSILSWVTAVQDDCAS